VSEPQWHSSLFKSLYSKKVNQVNLPLKQIETIRQIRPDYPKQVPGKVE
jgi:hypothetical protein